MRLAREKSTVITTEKTPFALGRAQVLVTGDDVTVIAAGPLLYEALLAAKAMHDKGVSVEVINLATVKPLDEQTILRSVKKTGAVVSVEEGQVNGGMGGAVAELLAERLPRPLYRIGVRDRFGQSGVPTQLWDEYELSAPHIVRAITQIIKRKSV